MYQFILASGSPRRKEILEQCGVSFIIEKSDAEEKITKEEPGEAVKELSALKAQDVADRIQEENCIILGADTIVANGQKILGKPQDEAEAYSMLSSLQGHAHSVYTGVTLIIRKGGKQELVSFYEETEVLIAPMTQLEIEDYVQTGEPMDKAGSYGIQGAFASYVQGIRGDYYNVVGLPICKIREELKIHGVHIKKDCKR